MILTNSSDKINFLDDKIDIIEKQLALQSTRLEHLFATKNELLETLSPIDDDEKAKLVQLELHCLEIVIDGLCKTKNTLLDLKKTYEDGTVNENPIHINELSQVII